MFPDECALTIQRTKNGWIVQPPLRGDYRSPQAAFVFTTAESLAAWISGWAIGIESNPVEPKATP